MAFLAVLSVIALTGCAQAPQVQPGQVLGYGTPGVSTYLPADEATTAQALLDRCRTTYPPVPNPTPQTFEAACDQLRRTARNQPGNTVAVPLP